MDDRGQLILIADDDVDLSRLLKDLLRMEGYCIEEARDGFQCFEKARSLKPFVIFMDIDMPIMNGLDACEKIKNDVETKDIPIIILSASARDEDRRKAKAYGVSHFLSKPVNIDEVLPILTKLAGNDAQTT